MANKKGRHRDRRGGNDHGRNHDQGEGMESTHQQWQPRMQAGKTGYMTAAEQIVGARASEIGELEFARRLAAVHAS